MECLQSTSLSFSSIIRGHHVYNTSWTPYLSEELVLAAEESNLFDRHAVAVLKNGEIVGHMPQELARFSWFFLKRDDGHVVTTACHCKHVDTHRRAPYSCKPRLGFYLRPASITLNSAIPPASI